VKKRPNNNMSTRRTKTLSIRISEDEYEMLRTLYNSNGARSVSETAREALHRLVENQDNPESDVEAALRSLDQKLGILQGAVSNLSRAVAERLMGEAKD
jgi:Arc/MetJ-type ribon-helix-helix transcriptional regulator